MPTNGSRTAKREAAALGVRFIGRHVVVTPARPRHRGGGARSALRRAGRRRAPSAARASSARASSRRSSRNVPDRSGCAVRARRSGRISRARARFRSAICCCCDRSSTSRAPTSSATSMRATRIRRGRQQRRSCAAAQCGAARRAAAARCAAPRISRRRRAFGRSGRRGGRSAARVAEGDLRACAGRRAGRHAAAGRARDAAAPRARPGCCVRGSRRTGIEAPVRARLLEMLDQARTRAAMRACWCGWAAAKCGAIAACCCCARPTTRARDRIVPLEGEERDIRCLRGAAYCASSA